LVGLWSSEGTSSLLASPASDISSGVETGRVDVIRFNGIGGGDPRDSNDEPLDIRRAVFDSGESTLADRPWLKTRCPPFSMLALRDTTTLFADCPRPCGCGRPTKVVGSDGVVLNEGTDAY
jgi:hypothetical protein